MVNTRHEKLDPFLIMRVGNEYKTRIGFNPLQNTSFPTSTVTLQQRNYMRLYTKWNDHIFKKLSKEAKFI